jgi:ATP-binding cassette subfamily B protein
MRPSPADDSPLREDEALGKAYDGRLMRRLLSYLDPYRWQTAGAVVMLIAASGLDLVGPILTKVAIDQAFPQADLGFLTLLAGAYGVSLLLSAALQYGRTLLTTWIGQRVMKDLRNQLFRRLQKLDLSFFDRKPVGRLMTRVTNDVEVLNEMFTSGVVTIFGDAFTLVFIMGVLVWMDWRLALVTFSVLPLVGVAAWIFRTRVREAYRDTRKWLARINSFLQERIGGMAVVQLFRQEDPARERFGELNDRYLHAWLRSVTYYAIFFPVVELFTAVAFALIIWYGGASALEGTITLGTIAAFLQYARRFFRPIQDLSEKYNVLQSAMASSERIFKLLDTEPEIIDPEEPKHLPEELEGRIEFEDVWFRYDAGGDEDGEVLHVGESERDWVLKGVSFTAEPGQRVAIVGPTGAGKSTIISLLMRFYEPQRGRITVDGVDVSEVPLGELRSRLGLVLQDLYLFSGSADENIRLDREGISDEEMREAARRVGVHRYVERMPGGYGQDLGERGGKLSVGERQLMSFARALAGDPPVLLLDEATSSVDSEVEALIERGLEKLMSGRTSIVVAHRLSTIQNADQILVLHHGEIRESGTHRELLREDGLYARLHQLQFEPTENVA